MIDYKGIEIPMTADDWQLFTRMKGSAKAAKELTAVLKKAFVKFDEMIADDEDVEEALAAAGGMVGSVMDRYARLGATDTESRGVAAQVLVDYAKLRLLGSLDETRYDWGDAATDGLFR